MTERSFAPPVSRFDIVRVLPVAGYFFLVFGLLVAAFIRITPESVPRAFANPALRDAVRLSLVTSVTSTFLSVVVAIPAGYMLSRHHFPGRTIIDTIMDLPLVLPPLVMGLYILIFFDTGIGRFLDRGLLDWFAGLIGWRNAPDGLFVYQPGGIILVQFTIGCAFAVRVMRAGFDGLESRYEEVAMALGANPRQAFARVMVPMLAPSILSAAVISWARLFGLFGPILLVCGTMRGRTEVMPTTIFLEITLGHVEEALVVAALIILISVTVLLVFKRLGGKEYLW